MNWKRSCVAVVMSLVGFWSPSAWAVVTGQYLLEGTGADTSGFGRDGTLAGSPTFTAGIYKNSNSALLLDGASQTVSLPSSTDFIRNAPGATLLAWVRPDNLTGTRTIAVVNNGDTASTTGIGDARAIIQFYGDGNAFRALGRQADGGGSSNTVGFTPVIGETYFVAGVFNYAGGSIDLFVNGQPVMSTSTAWNTNSADSANLAARIGSHANGTQEFWQGAIDGVRIYDEVLSPGDIFNIYAAEALAPLIPGDTNGNGIPGEPEDLTPIRTHWRQMVTSRIDGDLNSDMFVDFSDFREWKIAFLNAGSGSLADLDLGFVSAVPEPGTVWLAIVGMMGVFAAGRRRTFRGAIG
jgi:hypothetical protein